MDSIDSIAVFEWAEPALPGESAITPGRFNERVAAQFLAPENLRYLHSLFAQRVPPGPQRDYALRTLHDAAYEFGAGSSAGDSRLLDEVASDPLAQRGELTAALDLWAEVRRINHIFYTDRMSLFREQATNIREGEPRDGGRDGGREGNPREGIPPTYAVRDGISEDDESYEMRMFISDSLQPPGLERLNGPGPSWAIREDQSSWLPKSREGSLVAPSRGCRLSAGVFPPQPPRQPSTYFLPAQNLMKAAAQFPPPLGSVGRPAVEDSRRPEGRREAFTASPSGVPTRPWAGAWAGPRAGGYGTPEKLPARPSYAGNPPYGVDPLGAPMPNPRKWGPNGAGRSNMDPEAAVSEYWSDRWPASATTIGSTEIANVEYGDAESWGSRWQENGGTRFMRYEQIPLWQKGGRNGYDYDIEETLGTAGRELGSDVRRWDMHRVRTDAKARNAALMAGPPPYNSAAPYAPVRPVQWGRRFGPRSGGNV